MSVRVTRGRRCPAAGLAAVTVTALLAACGPPEIERLDADARILAFGDSLTHGTGAAPGDSYPAVLERRLGRRVVRAGKRGELAAQGRRRLPAVLERERPDLLILCHGGNDILRGRSPDAIRADLEAMIGMARRRGIPVVLVGVPARGLFPDTADLYYRIAEDAGVPLEDQALAEILADPSLRSDRVHPNAAGYRRMAAAIHRLLAEAGAVAAPG